MRNDLPPRTDRGRNPYSSAHAYAGLETQLLDAGAVFAPKYPHAQLRITAVCTAQNVVRVLERLKYDRGLPGRLYCDYGCEFVSALMDQWAYANGVKIECSRPGKPTDNAVIESCNGRFREECLNTHWFESLDDARAKIDAWRRDYDEHRPHRSLKGLTPREFARRAMLTGPADSQS